MHQQQFCNHTYQVALHGHDRVTMHRLQPINGGIYCFVQLTPQRGQLWGAE